MSKNISFVFWTILILIALIRVSTYKVDIPEGKKVKISGNVTNEPQFYSGNQQLIVSGIKAYVPSDKQISYGDYVVMEGMIQNGILKNSKLISITESKNIFKNYRNKLASFYKLSLGGDHLALVAGSVLGTKATLTHTFWEKLKVTGTAHVVVASGMNVSLVAGFIFSIFITITNRRRALALSIMAIWVYSFIVGSDAPIVRATIMGSLVYLSQMFGRVAAGIRTLLITAVLMLIIAPSWFNDTGFWLSTIATGSLLLLHDKVEGKLRFAPKILRGDLVTTFSAQIGVSPILYFTFGQLNLLSPFINALILWTIPLITVIGGVAGMIGLVFPVLGKLILILTYPLTSWFIMIINIFS